MLRRTGEWFKRKDEQYAKAIADMYLPNDKDFGNNESVLRGLGAGFLGGIPLSAIKETDAALPAVTGALARYAAPIGALTLAGKALFDLTQDYQTPGTLRPD